MVFAIVTKGILAPSSSPTAVTRVVRPWFRQAGRAYVGALCQVYGVIESKDGQIVVECTGIELGMDL